jgi:glutamate synthase domain-containing protein 3
MAQLGFKKVEEMVGRVDLLTLRPNPERKRTALVQLDAMLRSDHVHLGEPLHYCGKRAPESQTKMDRHIEHRLQLFWAQPKPKTINLSVANTDRTVGAALGGKIVSYFGNDGLPEGTLSLNFEGSAGQSFGAFVAPGLALRLQGEANDYLGKGLSGGSIVLLPPDNARFRSDRNIICGNVALYGATSGKVFISGMAGERFAVRNSGATAVVEGLGDHGCEYMTGGTVVVLGSTGKNFAAGMSGGVAYVYDPTEMFDTRCNLDMVELEGVWDREDRNTLKNLIEQHAQLTASRVAMNILEDWKAQYPLFVKVVPIEYRKVLERMKLNEYRDDETISATEEVYHG